MGSSKITTRQWQGRGSGRPLANGVGLSAIEICCADDRVGWGEPIFECSHRVFIARSGAYLRRVNGVISLVDSTSVLVTSPGDELSVAHPMGSGDTGTVVELSADVVAMLEEEGVRLTPGELRLDDQLDLQHRGLLAASRRGLDRFEAAEQLLRLVDRLVRPTATRPGQRHRPDTIAGHRRLVDRAREALIEARYSLGLQELAAVVGYSPHHLSRVFRETTGESLTGYRNRLRVRAVLSDMQDGAVNLRGLAAKYGFADQAHLTRVVRRQLGRVPSEVRQLIAQA